MNPVVPQVALTDAERDLGVSLPHRRMEEWKWTDLRRMVTSSYAPQTVKAKDTDVDRLLKAAPFAGLNFKRIVFVNGALDTVQSQIKAAPVKPADALASDEIVALSSRLSATGVTLTLDGNADTPIEILHISTDGPPRAHGVRHVIEVATGASATIVETFVGEGDYLSTAVIELRLAEGARLDYVKVEHEAEKATHLSHTIVSLAKSAVLRAFTLTSGSAINRQNGTFTFNGENADAKVAGAYLLKDKQHADTRLVVDHAVPNCLSRELFKVVMDGHSRGIFQGKVIVRPDAQKTDGKQSSHALLLSETAEFDAKPELEIYADDVVCGHGATSGDLNHDHMFYLKSRGIPEAEAKSLLIAAFVGEAIETVEHEGIREALTSYAEGWLSRH